MLADKKTASGIPLRSGIFFRSATLDAASPTDADRLINEIGIKTIIDLRSRAEGTANPLIHPKFRTLTSPDEIDGYLASARARSNEENGAPPSPDPSSRIIFRLDYLDAPTRQMFSLLSWWQKIIFLVLLVFWSRPAAIRYFVQRTMGAFENGLGHLNKEILDKSGKELRRVCCSQLGFWSGSGSGRSDTSFSFRCWKLCQIRNVTQFFSTARRARTGQA